MEWYHLFDTTTEKIVALSILAVCFALILYRKTVLSKIT